jgi:epsilon-lactone hydrolase
MAAMCESSDGGVMVKRRRAFEIILAGALVLSSWPGQTWTRAQPATDPPARVTVDRNGTFHMPAYDVPPSIYMSGEARNALIAPPYNSLVEMAARARVLYPVIVEERRIAGVRTDVVMPEGGVDPQNQNRVLMNLHGGGFFCERSIQLIESIPIASTAKITVISVDYRCAPKSKYPAASEDVATVYKELLKEYPPHNIGIYGCSAGGILVTESMAWFEKEKLPRPGAIGVFCAADAVDGGDSRFLATPFLYRGPPPPAVPNPPLLDRPYFTGQDRNDPLISPTLHPDLLAHFPPTLLVTGTRDFLSSGVIHAHSELVKLGIDAELHVWEGMGHAFFFDVELPESKDMYQVTARFFNRHLGGLKVPVRAPGDKS